MNAKKRQLENGKDSPKISKYFSTAEPDETSSDIEISEHDDNSLDRAGRNEADKESSGELTEPHAEASGGGTAAAGASDENDRGEHADKRRKVNGHGDEKASTSVPDELLVKLIDRIDQMNSNINDMASRMDRALTKIDSNKKEIDNLKEDQEGIKFEVESLKEKLQAREKENEKLHERLVDLAAREMRNTLVFQGFPEGVENKNCEKFIKAFASSHLQMEEADIIIERAHRSGNASSKSTSPRPRPIMVAFNRYQTKSMILTNARRFLKGKPFEHNGDHQIYVDEMLPKEIREQRKKLIHIKRKLKEENVNRVVYFKYPARIFYKDGKNGKEKEHKVK